MAATRDGDEPPRTLQRTAGTVRQPAREANGMRLPEPARKLWVAHGAEHRRCRHKAGLDTSVERRRIIARRADQGIAAALPTGRKKAAT